MRNNRIRHFLCDKNSSALEAVAAELDVDPGVAEEFFRLGAVYLNKTRLHDSSRAVADKDYVRVHTEPRRYEKPRDLVERRLFENEHWIVIDKSPGVPCHATLDNGRENLLAWWSEILGNGVHITHRLDVPTSGVLVLAKSPWAASQFNKMMLKGRVRKVYEVLVEGRFAREGLVTHWMNDDQWAPRTVTENPRDGDLECRLRVLSVVAGENYSRVRVRLETGRTHQIRAQMKAMGHPVVNDEMYGARRIDAREIIGLRSASLAFTAEYADGERVIEAPARWDEIFPDLSAALDRGARSDS